MKPAIFNTEMVRAILDGRKTQTRRTCLNIIEKYYGFLVCSKPNGKGHITPLKEFDIACKMAINHYSPYKVGDIIYVREQMYVNGCLDLYYSADDELVEFESCDWDYKGEYVGKIPSIHMPKEYARLFLRVKDVRIERLNEISKKDACDEGIDWINVDLWRTIKTCFKDYIVGNYPFMYDPISSFKTLWESIYGNGSFDNRYVWVIEFERISKEEAMCETAT